MSSGKRAAWPLRRRVLVAVVGLCAAGLGVFTASSVLLLEQSLVARADGQLRDMAAGIRNKGKPPAPPRDDDDLPTDFSMNVYTESGELRWRMPPDDTGGPAIPRQLVLDAPSAPVTVSDRQNDVDWRALTLDVRDGDRVVLAISLASTEDTVNQLLLIEVAVGVLILVLVVVVGRLVVRLGLRPLTRMERTATAIAAGEVELRVADSDPHTETGQLGRALNTMLSQLGVAMRARESSEQRLRRFVADASHELRTPLTSIRGFAELYRHGEAARDPAVERILRRIEDEAARMGVLVEDLLLLARLDLEPTLDLSDVDVHELVEDVVHDARVRHPARSITVGAPADRVRVLADGHRLHQVVANLVGNALTHSPPDTAVRVDLRHVPAGDEEREPSVIVGNSFPVGVAAVAIEVTDDGPGISAEHLPYVFDRFYRAGPARAPGSTGLGLAISAALVDAHDGRIAVSSAPGTATTFQVLLPVSGPAAS